MLWLLQNPHSQARSQAVRSAKWGSKASMSQCPVTDVSAHLDEGFYPSFDAKPHGNWVGIHREGSGDA